tara:strand:+ start:201 stop:806 length:606 start_codon:yes stop_codon:yes gene_type:complete
MNPLKFDNYPWAKMFLKHLPDEKESSREDYIRVREADNALANLSRQYPLWLAPIVNWILFAETDQLDDAGMFLCFFGSLMILIPSLLFTFAIGGIIRTHVFEQVGFKVYNSYDPDNPSYNKWNDRAVSDEERNYWIKQQKAWKGLFVKSNLVGMFFTIGFGLLFFFGYNTALFVISIIFGILLLVNMPESRDRYRWYRRKG